MMSRVSVTFLGSGDAFGSGGRFQTCLLVEAAGYRFLLNCGASALVAIKKRSVAPSTIAAILVTHLHGDHFGGIPFFILDAQFSGRETALLIAGPPRVSKRESETPWRCFFPGRLEPSKSSRSPSSSFQRTGRLGLALFK